MAMTERETLQAGLQLHQAGNLDAAEAEYRQVLAAAPGQPDALHLLGVLTHQRGRHELAVDLVGRAVLLRPEAPAYHNSLSLALMALGRLAEAEASCRRALQLQPNFAQAMSNLAILCRRAGRLGEAETLYREALRLSPGFADALYNFGNLLAEQDRLAEALDRYRQAVAFAPGREAHHVALGATLNRLGRLAEAEQACRAAIALAPERADNYYNLGIAQFGQDRLEAAEASYRQVLALDPRHQQAHYNLGHILLVTGRLEEGWPHVEWKAVTNVAGLRGFAPPLWTGDALGARTLLVHAEQGLGDTLQYIRYVPRIGGRVILEVQPPLLRLLAGLPGVAQLVGRGEKLPDFDLHCHLSALPRLLGTPIVEAIPAEIPYLRADPALSAAWRGRLASLDGGRSLRVGLVWAGGRSLDDTSQNEIDRHRSITLAQMAPLAGIGGVTYVSLQKGPPAAEAAAPPPGLTLHDFTAELGDFADTAALVEALDLVIGVDTSTIHVAGALGRPVWLLNRYHTCWRWLLDRADSPWYPTLRQFRQPALGDWASVMAAVRAALIERVSVR